MAKILINRTAAADSPPTQLEPGELSIEMNDPTRLWVGVPVELDPSGMKLLTEYGAAGRIFVDVSGDTMTGFLVLSGDPTVDLQAATKHYADLVADMVASAINAKVAKAGDTMTGMLSLNGAPTAGLHAATKKYVDDVMSGVNPPSASMPAGTVMVFYQATAPTGWTQLVSQNDQMLRVMTAGGTAGGVYPFSQIMAQTITGNFTTDGNYLPSHQHTFYEAAWNLGLASSNAMTGNTSGKLAADYAGGGWAHNHTILMQMMYIDVILASKN